MAILAVSFLVCSCSNDESVEEPEIEGEAATPVEVYSVQRLDLHRHLEFSGVLEAEGDVTISAETSGRVTSIFIPEGGTVNAGETVIKLDDTSARFGYEAATAGLNGAESSLAIAQDPVRPEQLAQIESALDAAEAQFVSAEAAWERARNLLDEGAISQAQYEASEAGYEAALAGRDSATEALNLALQGSREEEIMAARSGVDAARAQLGLASDMLDKTAIRSPIDGIISHIWFDAGELVNPGAPAFRIVNSNTLSFEIGLSDREVLFVSTGQGVDVRVDALPDDVLQGVITRVGVVADPLTGTFPVEITVYNDSGELMSGMITKAEILMEETPDSLVIPLYAVLPSDDEPAVFVEENGVANRRVVELGLIVDDLVSISSGIELNDRIVVRGAGYLADGDGVRVVREWESLDQY